MPDSKREAALKALNAVLVGLSGPTVLRNAVETVEIPPGGLIVLRDGDPGEPDILLSPATYAYSHRAEIVVQVTAADSAVRDAALDALLIAIGAAISADDSLGGAVDMAMIGGLELLDEPVAGGEAIKAALVPVTLDYDSPTPLG